MTAAEIKALLEEADERNKGSGPFRDPLVERLAALVRELTEWRPMESAPRDGTPVLIAHTCGDVFRARWIAAPKNYAGKGYWRFGERWAHDSELLGWLPLPPAPEVPKC